MRPFAGAGEGNRTPDIQLGRFLQTDPILFDGGMNLYAYAGNDPINLRDPLGLQEIVVTGIRDGRTFWGQNIFDGGGIYIPDVPPDDVGSTVTDEGDAIVVTGFRGGRGKGGGWFEDSGAQCFVVGAGNALVSLSDALGDLSVLGYIGGGALFIAGAVVGAPVVAPVTAVFLAASAIGVASGGAMLAGGTLQGVGAGQWGNAINGAASLAFGRAVGAATTPFARGASLSARERRIANFARSGGAFTGAGVDAMLAFLPPGGQVPCPSRN